MFLEICYPNLTIRESGPAVYGAPGRVQDYKGKSINLITNTKIVRKHFDRNYLADDITRRTHTCGTKNNQIPRYLTRLTLLLVY